MVKSQNIMQNPDTILKVNDLLPVGIIVIGVDGTISYVNERVPSLVAWLPQNPIGLKAAGIFPSLTEQIVAGLKRRVHTYGQIIEETEGILRIDLIPLLLQKGKNILVGLIEKQSPATTETFESGLHFDSQLVKILNYSFDGIWVCDASGTILHINETSARLNGFELQAIVGRKVNELVQEGIIDRSVTMEVIACKESVTFVQNLKSGKQALTTGSPMLDEEGNLSLVIVNERDITELGALKQELKKTQKLADEYRSELQQQNSSYTLFASGLFRSDIMLKIQGLINKVALTETTVVISGEPGTGRLDFARMIHFGSKRQKGPFVEIECATIPEQMMEGELFGLSARATPMLEEAKIGRIEMAVGGTICLSGTERLPTALQSRLLKFIETGRIRGDGGDQVVYPDVRILVIENQELQAAVRAGSFLQELYDQLTIVQIPVPPLRDHIDDVPLLIEYYLNRFNRKNHTAKSIQPRVIDCLSQYPFPGNLKELAILIEQIATLSQSNRIEIGDLPSHIQPATYLPAADEAAKIWNLPLAVERLEKKMIVDAFKLYSNQVQIALHLGINQSTLSRKLQKYNLKHAVRG